MRTVTLSDIRMRLDRMDRRLRDKAAKSDLRRFEARSDQRFKAIDARFKAVDKRFDAVDKRFDAMDRRFEAIDKRFMNVERRFDSLESKLDSLITAVNRDIRMIVDNHERRLQDLEAARPPAM